MKGKGTAYAKVEKWTGVEREVQYLYFSVGGALTLDPTIKQEWIEALEFDHTVLVKEKSIPPLDFKRWIDDKYIRSAYKDLGLDYDKDLAYTRDAKAENMKLKPAEIWHKDKGIVSYDTVAAMLTDKAAFDKAGSLRASYVFDNTTGLKIFGHIATYVKGKDGVVTAFMRKPDAEAFAKDGGGALMAASPAIETSSMSKIASLK